MNDAVFDPMSILTQETTAVFDTKITALPEGEYTAMVEAVDAVALGQNNSPALQITFHITDPTATQAMGMEKVTVRQVYWLDYGEDGQLAFGTNRNVRLGALREALGQNDGAPWSPSRLIGAGPLKVLVGHRMNDKTGEGPYANIKQVAAA